MRMGAEEDRRRRFLKNEERRRKGTRSRRLPRREAWWERGVGAVGSGEIEKGCH